MRQPKKKSKLIRLLIGLGIVLGLLFWHYNSSISSPVDSESSEKVSFIVKQGESVKSIAEKLEKEDLIHCANFFYIHTRLNNLGQNIQAGRFQLQKSMNTPEILDILSQASNGQAVVTIQEGLMLRQIDQKLEEQGLIKAGQFLEAVRKFDGWEYYDFLDKATLETLDLPLEGYIYPDTYFVDAVDFKANQLIYLALDNFESKFQELQKQLKKHSVQEIITMASIIENEVFGLEDRKLVSGILWKRLESGWTLGADATLLYITKDRSIDAKDLALNSQYNTRKNLGLPPGPISNPSLESIQAAMFPTSSPYWFYLTTLDTGRVIYSKSNEEHNQNRVKYL